MQSALFVRQTTDPTNKLLPSPARLSRNKFRQPIFRKSGKPRIALTDYYAKITTRRITFRMECVGKTCCAATYRVPLSAGITLPISIPDFAYWSWRRDLNPRPPDYKSGALPTELRQHRARVP